MTTFAQAIKNQTTRTTNGMVALHTTANACMDLFFAIGASRGRDIIPKFVAAYVEHPEYALRIAQYARDIRDGMGEREIFRQILQYLEINDVESAKKLMLKIPNLGRWDDLLVVTTTELQELAFSMINTAIVDAQKALADLNYTQDRFEKISAGRLAAKWCPRKGKVADKFRKFLKLTPKQYRRMIVDMTQVVEQQMCTRDWDRINFSSVPSMASRRYASAFSRHTKNFSEYVAKLKSRDGSAKVNAGAIYPYEIIAALQHSADANVIDHAIAQWDALPDLVGDHKILPMLDVSGSMLSPILGGNDATCLDVAVSLGIYLSDRNTGVFKDVFLTFSEQPEFVTVSGNIKQKMDQMNGSRWGLNTDLQSALGKILQLAVDHRIPADEMPEVLLILTDLQFDQCTDADTTAIEMIRQQYTTSGYAVPNVVFWNLNAKDNVPVRATEQGVALVSGFSPNIMTWILKSDPQKFTPEGVMLTAILQDKYDL